jgi:predicted unusual protein kinase regulating ubiquinone biosynthesis (AarF/ABC1/UbiB family)
MRKVISSEWGDDPERVLASIDPEPAAASIGQVYRGQTADGRDVAVKVQYPGVAEAVESDMRNVRMLAPLLRRLMPGLDVKPVLVELSERISAECDYELEASSHRRLARFWRGHPFITVPAVDTHLSRRRVLVSEWVDGIDFAAVGRRPDPVRDRYAEIIHRFYYGVARELDLALGDPHRQLFALRRRASRVPRLRHGARAPARLSSPGGGDLGRDPRSRPARARRSDADARLPAGEC